LGRAQAEVRCEVQAAARARELAQRPPTELVVHERGRLGVRFEEAPPTSAAAVQAGEEEEGEAGWAEQQLGLAANGAAAPAAASNGAEGEGAGGLVVESMLPSGMVAHLAVRGAIVNPGVGGLGILLSLRDRRLGAGGTGAGGDHGMDHNKN
jgi:hypothetical protein